MIVFRVHDKERPHVGAWSACPYEVWDSFNGDYARGIVADSPPGWSRYDWADACSRYHCACPTPEHLRAWFDNAAGVLRDYDCVVSAFYAPDALLAQSGRQCYIELDNSMKLGTYCPVEFMTKPLQYGIMYSATDYKLEQLPYQWAVDVGTATPMLFHSHEEAVTHAQHLTQLLGSEWVHILPYVKS